jgi:predicted RNA methylase
LSSTLRNGKNGSFLPAEHLEFVRNTKRVSAFRDAFSMLRGKKSMLDAGTGSGILSIMGKEVAGIEKVVALERDRRMANIAYANFQKRNANIELITADILNLKSWALTNPDVITCEMLSTWCILEPQIPVINHLLKIISSSHPDSSPSLIPQGITNYVEGVNAVFGDKDGLVHIPTPFFEFESTEPKAITMTSKSEHQIVFRSQMPPVINLKIQLYPIQRGKVNALRISSSAHVYGSIYLNGSDDTMPNMIVPLEKDVEPAGNDIELSIKYKPGFGWENFEINGLKILR